MMNECPHMHSIATESKQLFELHVDLDPNIDH